MSCHSPARRLHPEQIGGLVSQPFCTRFVYVSTLLREDLRETIMTQGTVSSETLREFGSMQEAFNAAAESAVATFGRPVSGVLYSQAGRRFICTSLPTKMLLAMVRRDSLGRKEDPSLHRNRPLDQGHVREIVDYLQNEPKYLLPPIMLNASSQLQIFAFGARGPTRPCVFVLPPDEYLYVTDGQHRLEALRQAMIERPNLEDDAVGVTIVEEASLEKVHQDFYDAAQVLQLAKALLVEYDGRAPINWATREVTNDVRIFQGRIERIGNVGKNSLMLFTTNQVKQGILQLVVGDWSLYAAAIQKQAEQAVSAAKDLWKAKVVAFFEEFSLTNAQWGSVRDRPLESGLTTDIPRLREQCLHFTGGGLLVLCGVGHSILSLQSEPGGALTTQQKGLIQSLSALDWSRKGALWQGHLVGTQGNVTPHKNNIVLAVAKAKNKLDLPVTPKEENAMRRAAEPVFSAL